MLLSEYLTCVRCFYCDFSTEMCRKLQFQCEEWEEKSVRWSAFGSCGINVRIMFSLVDRTLGGSRLPLQIKYSLYRGSDVCERNLCTACPGDLSNYYKFFPYCMFKINIVSSIIPKMEVQTPRNATCLKQFIRFSTLCWSFFFLCV